MSDFPHDQDSEILVRERARGTKVDGLYKKKKTKITTQDKSRRKQTYSKGDIGMQPTSSKSNQPDETQIPDQTKPTKESKTTRKPASARKSHKSKKQALPKQFHRLRNIDNLLETDTEEEHEVAKKIKEKPDTPTTSKDTEVKATINWETAIKQEEKETDEDAESTTTRRSQRSKQPPDYFGKPEIISISSDE